MELGQMLPLWSIVPFIGMLLSIAIFPLVNGKWWESHELHVAVFWAAIFLVPFAIGFGPEITAEQLSETIVGDYIPFIVLLLGLFVVAGGIHVRGIIVGTTRNNVILLLVGSFLASWVGTTGAAMLLIRPVLRANQWRRNKAHIVVFFIFMVANVGGCLTPLGDPPLFLGYLRGVPFFWTFAHMWPLLVLNMVLLVVVFIVIDRRYVGRESVEALENLELMDQTDERIPIRVEGKRNLLFLGLIIIAVILNGAIPQVDAFIDPATGKTFGVDVFGVYVGVDYVVQIALILVAIALSWTTTPKALRKRNNFEWTPIAEVAKLFIGIFITMIPALALLRAHGGSIGIDLPIEFFWTTGLLSSFLDNSPTYVVFLTAACAFGSSDPTAIVTSVGSIAEPTLLAVSAGAVFMGAMTYIGNAPNFMVKSIAERGNVKMPSFFGYMGWSCAILIPIFIIDTIVFFL